LLDQTFSTKNLRVISETEKRRGRVLDLKFFPELQLKTGILKRNIKYCKNFRRGKAGKYIDKDQAIYDHLRDYREAARNERDCQLIACLDDVVKNISKKSFSIDFEKLNGPKGKPVYSLKRDAPEHYYAEKQISKNLSRLYKVKQANRNQIVSQLADLLHDKFPYHFIRTDISNFYESIDHASLLKKLENDQLLSHKSLRLTKQLLTKFSSQVGSNGIGLPRGIGLSSYLAELYLRDFDQEIRGLEDVVFYARYVDDIVVVFAPTLMSSPKGYLPKIEAALEKKAYQKIKGKRTSQKLTMMVILFTAPT